MAHNPGVQPYQPQYEYIPANDNFRTKEIGFKLVLNWSLAFLLFGIISIVLISVHAFFQEYSKEVNKLFFCALIAAVIFSLMLLAGMLYLIFESRANKSTDALNNKAAVPFNALNNQADNEEDNAEEETNNNFNDLVISVYDNLQRTGSYSQTQLALATFGNKGKHYSDQLREILAENGRTF